MGETPRAGYCRCCWLAPSEREELDAMMRAGRMPWGSLRAFGLVWWHTRYHRRHLDRPSRFVYSSGAEGERRRVEGQRLAPWRWKPGESVREQCARAKREAAERRELAQQYRQAGERLRGGEEIP